MKLEKGQRFHETTNSGDGVQFVSVVGANESGFSIKLPNGTVRNFTLIPPDLPRPKFRAATKGRKGQIVKVANASGAYEVTECVHSNDGYLYRISDWKHDVPESQLSAIPPADIAGPEDAPEVKA